MNDRSAELERAYRLRDQWEADLHQPATHLGALLGWADAQIEIGMLEQNAGIPSQQPRGDDFRRKPCL